MFFTLLKKLKPFVWFVFSLSVWPVSSEELSTLNVRGFGTLGAAQSSSPDVEFIRDLSQPNGIKSHQWSTRTDTVLGVQTNWQPSPEFELVGQVVSRYQHDASRAALIDLAFVKWAPDDRLSLRAGRIGADLMMLADSRLVGYSYLTVRPSVDFFGPLFFSSFDGTDGTLTLPLGNGLIRSKLFAGIIQEKVSGAPGIWDTSGSGLYGLVVDYFSGNWQFRASSTSVRLSSDLNFASLTEPLKDTDIPSAIAAADALSAKDSYSRYYSLGLVYDKGPLQIQASANKITHESATFQNSYAGYFLAGYRIKAVTPFVGISRWKTRYKNIVTGLPDVPYAPYNQAYQVIMNASAVDQTTYTVGTRWDVWPKIALKLQWDAIHGTPNAKFPYANAHSGAQWNGRTNVISATMDFVF